MPNVLTIVREKILRLDSSSPVKKNLFYLLVTQVINYIFPLLTMKYLIVTLGVDYFGKISFAQAFLLYFTIITDYGFNITSTRDIARSSHDKASLRRIVAGTMGAKFVLLAVCTLVYVIIVLTTARFQSDSTLYLLFWGVVVGSCLFPQWYFQGVQKMGYITLVNTIIKVLLLLSVFLFIRQRGDYLLIPVIYSVSFILPSIYALYLCLRDCFDAPCFFSFRDEEGRGTRKLDKLRVDTVKAFRDGFPIFVSSSMSAILNGSSVFFMGFIVADEIIGFYSGYDRIVRACLLVFAPITNAIYPHVSELLSQNRQQGVHYIKKVALRTISLALLIALVMDCASGIIVPILFTDAFLEYRSVLYILSVWMVFSVGNNFIGVQYLTCTGHSRLYATLMAVCGLLSLLLIVILTQTISCYGTALAILAGEVLLTLLMVGNIKLRRL